MKKAFRDRYNHQNSILVVSLYPREGEVYSAGASGVASYAKNVVTHMKRNVVVLSDYEKKPEVYEEGNVLVVRCFKNKSPLMWGQLLRTIFEFSAVKHVLVQFDFATYGDWLTSGGVIPFLGVLKALKHEVSVINHHVVLDVTKLSGHVGLGRSLRDQVKGKIYNTAFHVFYKTLGIISKRIIVLEEPLRKKLLTILPRDHVITIPHGVDETLTSLPKDVARKKLGIPQNNYVVLFFGFVNWFKGADIFAKTFHDTHTLSGKKTTVLIAGGASPTLKDREYYQKYFTSVSETVDNSPSLHLTGYVPQEDIASYFSAADVVVFPYRYFMTASGVLSLVFSYKKPFIISCELEEMFHAPDFERALSAARLDTKDITFELTRPSLLAKTEKVLKNGVKRKMVKMAEAMRRERSYENTALRYEHVLFLSAAYNTSLPTMTFTLTKSYDK